LAISNKQKALIHVAKSKTGMSDAAYRQLLAGFGVSSCRDLTSADFDQVMRHFKDIGFKPLRKFRKPPESKKRLMAKIAAIQADMNLPDAYIDGIVRQMKLTNQDGRPVTSHRWLDADQLHRVVAALSYHQRRHPRKWESR
jgi:phage gp16-like protein